MGSTGRPRSPHRQGTVHVEEVAEQRDDQQLRICVDRVVPDRYQPARAATHKAYVRSALEQERLPPGVRARGAVPLPTLVAGSKPLPAVRAAIITMKMWQNGQHVRCRFLDGEAAWQTRVIANARLWEQYANITFDFGTDADAEVRISFFADSGSWSALGTDALVEGYFPKYQPTMNFGWLRGDTSDNEYERVVVHEFGHALGLIHEHQNPTETLQWDAAAVYRVFSGPPNYWTKDEIDQNILKRYSPAGLVTTAFDPQSIMLYQFDASLFLNHVGTPNNTTMSDKDKELIGQMYPR